MKALQRVVVVINPIFSKNDKIYNLIFRVSLFFMTMVLIYLGCVQSSPNTLHYDSNIKLTTLSVSHEQTYIGNTTKKPYVMSNYDAWNDDVNERSGLRGANQQIPPWVRPRKSRQPASLHEHVVKFPSLNELVCKSFWHDRWNGNLSACVEAALATRKEYLKTIETFPRYDSKQDYGLAIVFTTPVASQLKKVLTTIRYIRYKWGRIYVEIHSETTHTYKKCLQISEVNSCILLEVVSKTFAFKPLAMIKSKYRHVLFLDIDTVPVLNPLVLFKSDEYKKYGSIFWPDLWGLACKNIKWGKEKAMCGQAGWPNHVMWATLNITWKPSRSYAQEMDSGMVLVDTKKHWGPLALTYRLASDSFVQKVLYGDKDCFRFAWLAHGREFMYGPFPTQAVRASFRQYILHSWKGKTAFIHQHKSNVFDSYGIRVDHLGGTPLSKSPLCYDGCVSTNVTHLVDNDTAMSMHLWNQLARANITSVK